MACRADDRADAARVKGMRVSPLETLAGTSTKITNEIYFDSGLMHENNGDVNPRYGPRRGTRLLVRESHLRQSHSETKRLRKFWQEKGVLNSMTDINNACSYVSVAPIDERKFLNVIRRHALLPISD